MDLKYFKVLKAGQRYNASMGLIMKAFGFGNDNINYIYNTMADIFQDSFVEIFDIYYYYIFCGTFEEECVENRK